MRARVAPWQSSALTDGAALATVLGVLIGVPVMLSAVWIVNPSRGWYERGVPDDG
jgi:ACR3 family arsenite transporter